MRLRTVKGLALGLLMTLVIAAPAAAQSSSLTNVFAGLNLAVFEGETGFGFTGGLMKGVGSSGKMSIVGEAALSWYDGFNVTALQGGLAFKVWESGANAIGVRGVAGVEICGCFDETITDFAFEPGAFYTRQLNPKTNLHLGYGIRMVAFEEQWDVEHVFTFAIGFNIGG